VQVVVSQEARARIEPANSGFAVRSDLLRPFAPVCNPLRFGTFARGGFASFCTALRRLLALLTSGWVSAVIVLIGYLMINAALDNVIGPRFIAWQMKISPLLSFLSVIFWAWLLGPTGAILAVPLTVFIQDLAFGPGARPDLGRPEPVTPSAVPTP
jgi:hypothetical protein